MVPVPVPKPTTEPFPAELTVKCQDLPPLVDGMVIKDLVDQISKDQNQYNSCKEIHNKLVDQIFKRVQNN